MPKKWTNIIIIKLYTSACVCVYVIYNVWKNIIYKRFCHFSSSPKKKKVKRCRRQDINLRQWVNMKSYIRNLLVTISRNSVTRNPLVDIVRALKIWGSFILSISFMSFHISPFLSVACSLSFSTSLSYSWVFMSFHFFLYLVVIWASKRFFKIDCELYYLPYYVQWWKISI